MPKKKIDPLQLLAVKARLLEHRVTFWCINYIYTGTVVEITDQYICLRDAAVVYETGAFSDKAWKDAQSLPHEFYIMRDAIEGFGIVK